MCIIMNNPEEGIKTSGTLLIVTPLRTPRGEDQQFQLVYMNSVSARDGGKDPLMVVPIPNRHGLGEKDFPLFSVSKNDASSLIHLKDSMAKPYRPPGRQQLANKSSRERDRCHSPDGPPLAVQKVGDYAISVAPMLQDLEMRAPWARFGVRKEHAARIVSDMWSRYPVGFAFVIAEGKSKGAGLARRMEHMGFGVAYRDSSPQGMFFPTSHEATFDDVGEPRPSVEMDVTCVALGGVVLPGTYLPPRDHALLDVTHKLEDGLPKSREEACDRAKSEFPHNHVILRGDDSQCQHIPTRCWQDVGDIISVLPTRGAGAFHAHKLVQHEHVSIATLYSLHSDSRNADIYGRAATPTDAAAVGRIMQDVNAWLGYRRMVRPTPTGPTLEEDAEQLSESPRRSMADPYMRRRLAKLDFVLALLARQLADPGICDRLSDVSCPESPKPHECRGVAYHNLDVHNTDLDEMGYARKDTDARFLPGRDCPGSFDTLGCIYVRISAIPLEREESLMDRMVRDVPSKQTLTART